MDSEIGRYNYIIKYGLPLSEANAAEKTIKILSKRNMKLDENEWNVINKVRVRNTLDQQQLAERVIANGERVCTSTSDLSRKLKLDSEHRTQERITNIEFIIKELEIKRKELCLELDALNVFKTRVLDLLPSLDDALDACGRCVILRERRVMVDLVYDDVDKALENEIKIINGVKRLLNGALGRLEEEMRKLRAARYELDQDIHNKKIALEIDTKTLLMDESMNHGSGFVEMNNVDVAIPTNDDWKWNTVNVINKASKQLEDAKKVHQFIEQLFVQVYSNLKEASEKTNFTFITRIKSLKRAKDHLDELHSETVKRAQDVKENIILLENDIEMKKKQLILVRSRLRQRACRPRPERIEDSVEAALGKEMESLIESLNELLKSKSESERSLRYLNQCQVEIEEDINIKNNSIKIDEVDCLQIRNAVAFHPY